MWNDDIWRLGKAFQLGVPLISLFFKPRWFFWNCHFIVSLYILIILFCIPMMALIFSISNAFSDQLILVFSVIKNWLPTNKLNIFRELSNHCTPFAEPYHPLIFLKNVVFLRHAVFNCGVNSWRFRTTLMIKKRFPERSKLQTMPASWAAQNSSFHCCMLWLIPLLLCVIHLKLFSIFLS